MKSQSQSQLQASSPRSPRLSSLAGISSKLQSRTQASWMSLYNTDIRNLMPKYELTKIEKSKLKYDKFKLIMDNIDQFLYMERHRSNIAPLPGNQIDSIKKDIADICQSQQHYDYQLNIIKYRDQAQIIADCINRYGNSEYSRISTDNEAGKINRSKSFPKQAQKRDESTRYLDDLVSNNKKWSQYFKQNCKKPQKIQAESRRIQKLQLSTTIELPFSPIGQEMDMNESTCSQIMLNRLKREDLNRKIWQQWMDNSDNGSKNQHFDTVEKQFMHQFKVKVKDIDFKQYV